jgi:hypothetical protein
VDYCCFIGSKLQQLCWRSCTRFWHSSPLKQKCQWFSRCITLPIHFRL